MIKLPSCWQICALNTSWLLLSAKSWSGSQGFGYILPIIWTTFNSCPYKTFILYKSVGTFILFILVFHTPCKISQCTTKHSWNHSYTVPLLSFVFLGYFSTNGPINFLSHVFTCWCLFYLVIYFHTCLMSYYIKNRGVWV